MHTKTGGQKGYHYVSITSQGLRSATGNDCYWGLPVFGPKNPAFLVTWEDGQTRFERWKHKKEWSPDDLADIYAEFEAKDIKKRRRWPIIFCEPFEVNGPIEKEVVAHAQVLVTRVNIYAVEGRNTGLYPPGVLNGCVTIKSSEIMSVLEKDWQPSQQEAKGECARTGR